MTLSLRLFVVVFLLLTSAACSSIQTRTQILPVPEAGALLGTSMGRFSSLKSLDGRMSVKVYRMEKKYSSSQLVMLSKPSSLRLDALNPFGQPVLTMSTDGKEIYVSDLRNKRYFRGDPSKKSISALFPASLSLADIVLILAGEMPLIDYDKSFVSSGDNGSTLRLILEKGDIKEELVYENNQKDLVSGEIFNGSGERLLSVSMDKYREIDGVTVPMSIIISVPLEGYRMEVAYSKITPNSLSPDMSFVIDAPEGAEVEDIEKLSF